MNKIVRVIKLPTTIRGVTIPDPEGCYNVYINKNLSCEMQKEVLLHETAHIVNGDFCSNEPVSVLEERAKYENKAFRGNGGD